MISMPTIYCCLIHVILILKFLVMEIKYEDPLQFFVMYLSDIKSCVARTSIGAQFLSVGAQFLSVGAQLLTIGAQDAPASCYELCVK